MKHKLQNKQQNNQQNNQIWGLAGYKTYISQILIHAQNVQVEDGPVQTKTINYGNYGIQTRSRSKGSQNSLDAFLYRSKGSRGSQYSFDVFFIDLGLRKSFQHLVIAPALKHESQCFSFFACECDQLMGSLVRDRKYFVTKILK